MWDIILPYLPNFFKSFGFLLFLQVDYFGLGFFSKISLSAMMAILLGPSEFSVTTTIINFLFGCAVALPVIVIIEVLTGSSEVLSLVLGLNYASIYDPSTQRESLPLVNLIKLLVISIFLNNHFHLCFDVLASSSFTTINTDIIFDVLTKLFKLFSKILFPFVLVFTTVEIFLALFQRVLPSLSMQFEVQSIKIALFFALGLSLTEARYLESLVTVISNTFFDILHILK